MTSLEGYNPGNHQYNASYYAVAVYDDTWTKIEFLDYLGVQFESRHIRIKSTSKNVYFSFDPRAVVDAERVVQGLVKENETLLLRDKHANEIYLMRAGVDDATVEVMAWR